jgi:hypothetical protein
LLLVNERAPLEHFLCRELSSDRAARGRAEPALRFYPEVMMCGDAARIRTAGAGPKFVRR